MEIHVKSFFMISTADAKELVERIFRDHPTKDFAVRLWDGTTVAWGNPAAYTLIFSDAETFADCMRSGDPSRFAEAYVNGHFDIEGDIYGALGLKDYLSSVQLSTMEKLKAAAKLGVPQTRHTKEDDMRDVQAHYDLSNEFYQLFLDPKMIYSCAYFETPDTALEKAQERKLDLVCRKLRLKPGERFLDVGCGWGALVIWAAQHYGVEAHGITLSQNQYDLATQRVRDAGLEGKITIELKHYLDLPSDAFDKIASVGMVEHVGIAKYPEYFNALHRALRSGGLLLNHGITIKQKELDFIGGEFIFRHVFPGAELDTISDMLVHNQKAGFEILDVEELRLHYALTLRAWNERYRSNKATMAGMVPEKVLRVWDLYLPGCALAFEEGSIEVHQTLSAKNAPNGKNIAPLTREDIYRTPLAS